MASVLAYPSRPVVLVGSKTLSDHNATNTPRMRPYRNDYLRYHSKPPPRSGYRDPFRGGSLSSGPCPDEQLQFPEVTDTDLARQKSPMICNLKINLINCSYETRTLCQEPGKNPPVIGYDHSAVGRLFDEVGINITSIFDPEDGTFDEG